MMKHCQFHYPTDITDNVNIYVAVMKVLNVRLDKPQDAALESSSHEGSMTKANQFRIPTSVLKQVVRHPAGKFIYNSRL
jgi:hypothetical protein